jgi:SH3-like domain-containing protein
MREAAVFTALVILTAGGGMLAGRAAGRRPEAVVTAADTSARIAPAGEAPVSAEIPRGSVVRLAEEAPGWVKVVGADRSGWLPQSAVTRVRL